MRPDDSKSLLERVYVFKATVSAAVLSLTESGSGSDSDLS